MTYSELLSLLTNSKKTWLVTGAAGFIGSHLVEQLIRHNQLVIGIDDFSTGKKENLDQIQKMNPELFSNFKFHQGDIRDFEFCAKTLVGVDICLHQAALGSVPRSIKDPFTTHDVNVNGFCNILRAATDNGVKRIVYASSSSVYGDDPNLPKREEILGRPLSPYALSKAVNESYARIFSDLKQISCIGLRYFNVFGARQDPNGDYAAVIPKWISALLAGEPCVIYGDGETSRDFCFVDNVVQANILAGLTENHEALNKAYNVGCGSQTTLLELYRLIESALLDARLIEKKQEPIFKSFRDGDVRHSLADISRAQKFLRYEPSVLIQEGMKTLVSSVSK